MFGESNIKLLLIVYLGLAPYLLKMIRRHNYKLPTLVSFLRRRTRWFDTSGVLSSIICWKIIYHCVDVVVNQILKNQSLFYGNRDQHMYQQLDKTIVSIDARTRSSFIEHWLIDLFNSFAIDDDREWIVVVAIVCCCFCCCSLYCM